MINSLHLYKKYEYFELIHKTRKWFLKQFFIIYKEREEKKKEILILNEYVYHSFLVRACVYGMSRH